MKPNLRLSEACNPFLYFFSSQDLRRAFMKCLDMARTCMGLKHPAATHTQLHVVTSTSNSRSRSSTDL